MRYTLLLWMLFAILPGQAAETMKMDERLNQTIAVAEKGDRLGNVLKRLSEKTGVKMDTAAPVMDRTTVTVRYEGTAGGFMNALASFFATSKDHKPIWMAKEGDGGLRYRLAYTEAAVTEKQRLVKTRQETLDAGMNKALQDGNQWVKHLGFLSDNERRAVYKGEWYTNSANFFGGREFLKEVLRDDERNWGDDVGVTYQMRGHSPLTRILHRRMEDVERGTIVEETFSVAQICPQLSPETQQKEWVLHYGDPQPRTTLTFILAWDKEQNTARREALYRIAEMANVNLIADDFGQEFRPGQLPTTGSLSTLLDNVCRFQYGSGQTPDTNHGSFWRKVEGDTFLVRSIAWPEEEEVPS